MFLEPVADHERDRTGVAIDRIEPLAHTLARRQKTAIKTLSAGALRLDEIDAPSIDSLKRRGMLPRYAKRRMRRERHSEGLKKA